MLTLCSSIVDLTRIKIQLWIKINLGHPDKAMTSSGMILRIFQCKIPTGKVILGCKKTSATITYSELFQCLQPNITLQWTKSLPKSTLSSLKFHPPLKAPPFDT